MEIRGEPIILRDYTEQDFAEYAELEQNELTYKYENHAPDANQIKDTFLKILSNSTSNPRVRYELAICLQADKKPIGISSLRLNWAEIREWEIGWALHPAYWKQGYATEAVKVLLGYAFNHLQAHRILAYANAENALSEQVMIRAGMTKEGVLRETRLCNHKWCDELIYSMLDKEAAPFRIT